MHIKKPISAKDFILLLTIIHYVQLNYKLHFLLLVFFRHPFLFCPFTNEQLCLLTSSKKGGDPPPSYLPLAVCVFIHNTAVQKKRSRWEMWVWGEQIHHGLAAHVSFVLSALILPVTDSHTLTVFLKCI